ncbi:MAG: hypothetical protein HYU51_13070 [Candidatus Rokubacteria bacterium]|nr:hypothetical protein [Candidatus Rokubacteria bacterium]
MELFLMVVFVSLLCLAVTALAFSAASSEPDAADRVSAEQLAEARPAAAPRFFAEDAVTPPSPPIPLNRRPPTVRPEALLLQIERHIRLEQAAAEAFLDRPTPESLHGRTTSPLLN